VVVKDIHGIGHGSGTTDLATLAATGDLTLDLASVMATQGEATGMRLSVKTTVASK
jgi:hypothetical protein